MKFQALLLLMLILAVSACATQTTISPQEAASKLPKSTGNGEAQFFIEVPAASNSISNQMVAVALNSGTDSLVSANIQKLLQASKNVTVISKSNTVLCATLKRSLIQITKIQTLPPTVTIFGNKDLCSSLVGLARNKGVTLNLIQYP